MPHPAIKRRKVVDYRWVGRLEYLLRRRRLREQWGGAFNGQQFRQRIVRELLAAVPFDALVETGTFRGSSTEFLSRISPLPIYTVEANPRYFAFARARFRSIPQIRLFAGDSRRFLETLATLPELRGSRLLFYLDSHWFADLPLAEEVRLVFATWESPVVLIDDFRVPDDPGYAYDDYGSGRALTLEYLAPLSDLGFATFFPACPSAEETGGRRGSVVLCTETDARTRLAGLGTLRRWPAAD